MGIYYTMSVGYGFSFEQENLPEPFVDFTWGDWHRETDRIREVIESLGVDPDKIVFDLGGDYMGIGGMIYSFFAKDSYTHGEIYDKVGIVSASTDDSSDVMALAVSLGVPPDEVGPKVIVSVS